MCSNFLSISSYTLKVTFWFPDSMNSLAECLGEDNFCVVLQASQMPM